MSAIRSHLVAALLFIVVLPISASAQTTVRVTTDRAIIWRPGFFAPATVVNTGTVLEVVGRQGDWYEVILPPTGTTSSRDHGFVAVSQVVVVTGSVPQRPETPTPTPVAPRPSRERATPQPESKPQRTPTAKTSGPSLSVRGFGEVGYVWLSAHDSAKAIFDQAGAPRFGGGGEIGLGNGLLLRGSVQWLQQTGERVFVFDNTVTKLGITDTVTIIPVDVTVGYRFRRPGGATYVGGGVGTAIYKETFQFADPSENLDERFTSYHALVGFERQTNRWSAVAVEFQYSHVPNALTGNVAEGFNEHDLGGFDVRVKVSFGK
jgi:hypothetical protein